MIADKSWIFVFTGPDGSGRKTVAEACGITFAMKRIVSYTTRPKRPSEEEGQDYFFIDRHTYELGVAQGEFVEHVILDGHGYGIKSKDIAQGSRQKHVYLVLNPHGAQCIKETYGDRVVRIFMYADRNTVEARQQKQGDTPEAISRHLSRYDTDIAYALECEHRVENIDDLGHTVYHVTTIMDQYVKQEWIDKD